jgi:hypothetical protein
MKKIIKYFLFIALAGGIGYGIYIYFVSPQDSFQSIYLVPKNAVYIIETDEPIQSWKKISDSRIWKHMRTQPYFNELTNSANSLDSLIRSNEKLFDMLGSRNVIVSSHIYAPKKYDHLFIVDLQKASRLEFLQQYLTHMSGGDFKITERNHNGNMITELFNKKSRETLYLAFIKNLLVCSYTNSLVEASIEEMDKPHIGRDNNYIEIKKAVNDDGLFNVYLHYSFLNSYMMCFLAEQNENIKALSKSLHYTALNVSMDDDDKITMDGFTNINDSVSSYLKAMLLSGKGSLTAQEVIPDRTAYYMSLSVNKFDVFYDHLKTIMRDADPEFSENEKDINRIENFLKISVKDNFVNWIGEEVAFVQTQPKGLGKSNEFAVVLKAKDIAMAKENLDYIVKQVRKRSPVKFSEFDYKGYPVNYMEVKGFFKVALGKFFKGLEKPYYTIIHDYVIFSNHPQTIKSIIDDYKAGRTLGKKEEYNTFMENFESSSNVFIYGHLPILHPALKGFLSAETWIAADKNKEYIICFPHIGFQMLEKDNLFKVKFISLYQDMEEVKLKLLQTNQPSGSEAIDTLKEDNDEMYLEDLDAKKFTDKYPDGTIHMEVYIKNGLRTGTYKEYHPNGEIKIKGHYENDMKEGTFKYYDEDGKLLEKKEFDKGVELKSE